MEISEAQTSPPAALDQEAGNMTGHVETSTETACPSPATHSTTQKQRDGSVVSAMTEEPLDGLALQDPLAGSMLSTGTSPTVDGDVPEQVVLEEKDENVSGTDEPVVTTVDSSTKEEASAALSSVPSETDSASNEAETPLVVTTESPETDSVVSMSAVPDPPPSLKVETTHRAKARTVAADTMGDEESTTTDYIQSPEVQNAIVERSPGGRYVRFMEKLGSGASKDVYRAYDTQEGIEVAWNVVNLSGVPKSERNRIVNEVRLLERLHHRNIISFHGSWVNRERQEVNFVTEILSSGTLKSFIAKVQVIRWKIAKRWAVQILKGLEYLHSQDPPVIHRDLKCENIFINGTSGDLRIGDLGLSTVHRNERVLSVLGTPEFMAPDMYEESSYDEKVDIYAFGMCMLEIFTKEIPYRECKNPAQIYKKVSSGEPPEVLSRLQSQHAREFVILCLGYRDDNGRYVRPSATELLQHPFLVKRTNDDDEVVVDRPLHERVITEAGESSVSPNGSPSSRPPASGAGDSGKVSNSTPPARGDGRGDDSTIRTHPQRTHSSNSLEEYDGDTFEEMPQSETNMKKVKVMMGRGQELEEDESSSRREDRDSGGVASHNAADTAPQDPKTSGQYLVAAAVLGNESQNTRPYPDDVLKLVITLPVEGQTQNVQFDFHLVEDDPVKVAKEMVGELGIPQGAVLEISGTISALACAARMKVDKFNSGMQNAHGQLHPHTQQGIVQQGQLQHHMDQSQLVSQQSVGQGTPQQGNVDQGGQMPVQQVSQQPMYMQSQNATYMNPGTDAQVPSQPVHPHQAQMPQLQPVAYSHQHHAQPAHQQGQSLHMSMMQPTQQPHAEQMGHGAPHQMIPQHSHAMMSQGGIGQSHGAGNVGQSQQGTPQPAHMMGVHHQQSVGAQHSSLQGMVPQNGTVQAGLSHAMSQQPGVSQANATNTQAVAQHASGNGVSGQQGTSYPGVANGAQIPQHAHVQRQGSPAIQPEIAGVDTASQQGSVVSAPMAPGSAGASQQGTLPASQGQGPVPQVLNMPGHEVPPLQNSYAGPAPSQSAVPASIPSQVIAVPAGGGNDDGSNSQILPGSPQAGSTVPSNHVQRTTSITAVSNEPIPLHGNRQRSLSASQDISIQMDEFGDEGDPGLQEELRKLEDDYQRTLQRAQKVFDNRMDNLQRSQIEREAQHQKIIEKHEKDRAEYERRLAQEAEQQSRRIEQLQREWDRKREMLAQAKRKKAEDVGKVNGTNALNVIQERQQPGPLPQQSTVGMHRRTDSAASSSNASLPLLQTEQSQQQSDTTDGGVDR